MNGVISHNKVRESIRNDLTSVLICFPRQNIRNGGTERSKKNSEGSGVSYYSVKVITLKDYFRID